LSIHRVGTTRSGDRHSVPEVHCAIRDVAYGRRHSTQQPANDDLESGRPGLLSWQNLDAIELIDR
jgi:hypothetical protein